MHDTQQRLPDMQTDRSRGKLSWGKERGVGRRYKVKWLHCVSVY